MATDKQVGALAKKLNYEFINSVYRAKGSTHDSEWDCLNVGYKRMWLFTARFLSESGVLEKIEITNEPRYNIVDGNYTEEVVDIEGVKARNVAVDKLIGGE